MEKSLQNNTESNSCLAAKDKSSSLKTKLDRNFILQKQKDPEEWRRFLEKGKILVKLIEQLRSK